MLFEGPSNLLVDYWKKKKFIYLLSNPILEEYIKVLSYPKFQLAETEIKEIINNQLLPYIEVVKLKTHLSIIKEDTFDNVFLSTAIDGKAKFVLSGDMHLLNIGKYKNVSILKIGEFLKLYRK